MCFKCPTRTLVVFGWLALAGLTAGSALAQQTISTTVYFDYTAYVSNDGPKTLDTGPGFKNNFFAFRRAYFTYENKLSDFLRFRFRYDADNTANVTSVSVADSVTLKTKQDDKLRPYVKHIYLQYGGLAPNSSLALGMIETLTFKPAEERWGYRSVAKTIMDNFKDVTGTSIDATSADLGVSWGHSLSKYAKYAGMVSNGSHYSHGEDDKYKKYMGQLAVNPLAGLSFVAYGDYERQPSANEESQAVTLKGDAFFQMIRNLVAGIEYFTYDSDLNTLNGTQYKSSGLSVFGRYLISSDRLAAFARYDLYEPNSERDDDEVSVIIAGLDWAPPIGNLATGIPAFRVQPNVFVYSYEDSDLNSDIIANLTFLIGF